MKVAVKYFYKEIEYVATTIWRLGLTDRLVEAARQQNLEKINLIVKEFKRSHPEFWKRMLELYYDYQSENWPTIFTRETNNEYYIYDSLKIKPMDLICCCALSDIVMCPDDLFDDCKILKIALQEEGYFELADYIEKDELSQVSDLLKAFKKE